MWLILCGKYLLVWNKCIDSLIPVYIYHPLIIQCWKMDPLCIWAHRNWPAGMTKFINTPFKRPFLHNMHHFVGEVAGWVLLCVAFFPHEPSVWINMLNHLLSIFKLGQESKVCFVFVVFLQVKCFHFCRAGFTNIILGAFPSFHKCCWPSSNTSPHLRHFQQQNFNGPVCTWLLPHASQPASLKWHSSFTNMIFPMVKAIEEHFT